MNENVNKGSGLVVQNDKKVLLNAFTLPLAAIAIYSMIIPVIFLDIWTTVYQAIYFSAAGIPKIKKKDYIIFDRWDLRQLNILQRINCVYCEYVNGLLAWAKSVSNQTEVYSCAIKHSAPRKGQEHQEKFYEYEEFR